MRWWLRALIACVWVGVGSGLARASDVRWEFAGWYGGGCYPNIEFDPVRSGRLYLTSDVAGLWRSDDNGDTWSFMTKGLNNLLVSQVKVSPANPDIVYAATAAGVSVSLDAGEHWASLDNLNGRIEFQRPKSYRAIWADDADDRSLCVGTSRGEVFCSNDRGRTWRDLHLPHLAQRSSAVVALHRLPDKSGLLAATANGISVYKYASQTWTSAPQLTGISDVIPYRGTFLAASNSGIWRSDANGTSWSRMESTHPDFVFRLEESQRSGQVYIARNKGWNGEVFTSNDGLKSWQAIPSPARGDVRSDPTRAWAHPGGPTTALKTSPFDTNVIFRTDWWGVWRSLDGGKTWQEKIVGTPNTVGTDIVALDRQTVMAATMDNGLLESADGGVSFTALFPSDGYKDDENGHVWRVISPSPGRIVATSSPWNQQINQVLLSDDGGKTFEKIRAGLPAKRPVVNTLWDQGYPRVLVIDPHNDKRLYLGIDGDDGGGLFITEDGGRTWSRSAGQPPSRKIYSAFAVDREKAGYLYWGTVGDRGGIYRSTDDGRTWAPVFQASRAIFDMTTSANGTIYATGIGKGGAIFLSRDHGETWNTLVQFPDAETTKAIAVSPADPNILVTSTVSWASKAPQKFYASNDGGRTWIDITGNLPDGAGAAAFAFNPDGSLLYMSRYAGSIYKLKMDQLTGLKKATPR